MSGADRCDEIVRLIDEVLADQPVVGTAVRSRLVRQEPQSSPCPLGTAAESLSARSLSR